MRGSDFIFDCVYLLYYKCHEINFQGAGQYIDHNSHNIHNSCVKSWRSKKDPERIIKIKHFMDKYTWEWINYPLEKNNWKKIEKNNQAITLNTLYAKKEKTWITSKKLLENKDFCDVVMPSKDGYFNIF